MKGVLLQQGCSEVGVLLRRLRLGLQTLRWSITGEAILGSSSGLGEEWFQPLPAKVLVIGAMGMAANVPLGMWREHIEKFSPSWFVAVHAAVPFIGMLRKSVLMPKSAMAFTIAASVLGQVIGSRAERYRLKAKADASHEVTAMGGHCGEPVEWDSESLQGYPKNCKLFIEIVIE